MLGWLRRLLDPPRCQHARWRPAVVRGKPGRVCEACSLDQVIEEWEFLAQFGEAMFRRLKLRERR